MATDLTQKNILIAGIARNCAATIAADILRLQYALPPFASVSWLIIESDSNDATMQALENLAKTVPHFRHLSLGTLRTTLPLRTQRIAHCRNAYLQELEQNPLYAAIDYVLMSDLDGMNDLLDQQAIASCWARDDWDMCAANQRARYYDIWALRHPVWSPDDCWEQQHFLMQSGISREASLCAAVHARMIIIPENAAWIPVDSAFGGLAIYRRAALTNLRYEGLTPEGAEICEHVTLNHHLKTNGGRLFINPRLINTGKTPHAAQRDFWPSLRRRATYGMKQLRASLKDT